METENGIRTFSEKDDEQHYTRSTYAYQLDHVIKMLTSKASAFTGGADAVNNMRYLRNRRIGPTIKLRFKLCLFFKND